MYSQRSIPEIISDTRIIFPPGTFKRTFFFAAPSDALMLQWANVLEKVKNAEEGECEAVR